MSSLLIQLLALRVDRGAVTALEYGLIAAVVVAIGLVGFSIIGTDIEDKFNNVSNVLS